MPGITQQLVMQSNFTGLPQSGAQMVHGRTTRE
jgi:hypothetical protein